VGAHTVETVATIFDRSTPQFIDEWFDQVQADNELTKVHLTREERCSHLPQVFRDLVGSSEREPPHCD
jgi:hypothetical protein